MTDYPSYGRHITRPEADEMFNNARTIESEKDALLKQSFANDPEALEYYGRPIYGFVFKKQPLQELLDKLDSDNHHLVLLTGSKAGITGNGKRIIMAMVYLENSDGMLILDTQTMSAGGIGTQHPGIITGTGNPTEIPSTIPPSDIEDSDSTGSSQSSAT